MAKIRYKAHGYSENESDVAGYVADSLEDKYTEGVAESAQAHARNNSIAIGKIVEALHSKGVLSDSDVKDISDSSYGLELFEIIKD